MRFAPLVAAVLALAVGCRVEPAAPKSAPAPAEVGQPSLTAGITAESLDGSVHLGELAGHPAVVTFWAPWSEPSVAILPALQEAQDALRDVRFVGVALDARDPVLLQSLADSLGVGLPLALDPDREVAARFGVDGVDAMLPATFVLDADGRIVARRTGRAAAADLADLVRPVLPPTGPSRSPVPAPHAPQAAQP